MKEAIEPGELRDGRYVIPSDDDHYGPTVITTTQPRKRDFLRVLFGRWRAEVVTRRSLTLKGTATVLRETWTGPRMMEAMYADNPFLEQFQKKRAG